MPFPRLLQRAPLVVAWCLIVSASLSRAVPVAVDDVFAVDEDQQLVVSGLADLFFADFDNAANPTAGFSYIDDPYQTGGALFASGTHDPAAGFTGGGLSMTVGGRLLQAGPASAAFQRSFVLAAPARVEVSLRYRLVHDADFEAAEFSQAILEVDGSRPGADADGSLVSFAGDGNGGPDADSGWRSGTFAFDLAAGAHVIRLALYNNRSSSIGELASAYFDDVRVAAAQPVAGVLSNDSGNALIAELASVPANGNVNLDPSGTFVYVPNPDFHGTDAFTYRALEGSTASAPATVTITVRPVDDPPRPQPDTYSVNEDAVLQIGAASGVLRNDLDPEGSPLTAALVAPPARGQLAFSPDGSFVYTPFPNLNGPDTFTYRVGDGRLVSPPATVTLAVRPVGDPPVPMDDAYTAQENAPLVIAAATGGRIEVYRETFDDGVADGFFGVTDVESVQDFSGLGSSPANRFAGSFLRNDTTGNPASATSLTLSNLPPHDRISLGFLLAVIDSWEGDNGPDRFTVSVDGVVVFSETLSTSDRAQQSYQPAGGAELAFARQLGFRSGAGFADAAYDLALEPGLQSIPHSAPSVTITWTASGAGWEGADNESWALDNVSVAVTSAGPIGELVSSGAEWKYRDTGEDLGTAWRNPAFDDSAWESGPSRLGYGGDGEATTISFGDDPNDKIVTAYFRHRFEVGDPSSIVSARLRLVRDDGAAVYLNGTEIARSNLPADADYRTFSIAGTGGADETRFFDFAVPPALLVAGTNVLAAEVHQSDVGSSDLALDAVLEIERSLVAGVLANDADADGDPLTAQLATPPAHGSVALNPDGTFTYTPALNYDGPDSFTYTVGDGTFAADATVRITVRPGSNELPVPAPDQYTVTEDGVLTVSRAQGVLANDRDPEGNPMTATLARPPANGQVVLNPDGSFVYRPAPDYHGPDSFTYIPADPSGPSLEGTVAITVNPVNDPPVAAPDAYAVDPNTTLTVASAAGGVLGNDSDIDGDTLVAQPLSLPGSGSLTLSQNGTFTYRPNPGFRGTDSFTYRGVDPSGASAAATVTIRVNSRPTSAPDEYATDEDVVLVVDAAAGVLANDSDPDGPPATATLVDPPTHGIVALSPDGSFNYIPAPNFSGIDGFTYRASDGLQSAAPAAVTIVVTAVNDPPSASRDRYSVTTGASLSVAAPDGLLRNDSDAEGSPLTAILVQPPTTGELALAPNGSFSFTPPAAFSGTVVFSYRASDGVATSEPTDVEITVRIPAETVVISEIMYHPASENDAEEFIELHNAGESPVNLAGWRFTSGIDFTFPDVVIAPGGFVVVAADPVAFVAAYGEPPAGSPLVGGWTGRLSNGGERVRLVDAAGFESDDFRFGDDGDWALRRFVTVGSERGWEWLAEHDGGGASLELVNAAIPNRFGTNWAASPVGSPTPGAPNAAADAEPAPVITDVRHRPAVPKSTEPVVVTARIADDDPATIPTATLRYRVSRTGNPAAFAAIPMTDDGRGADRTAGDGIHSATIPALPNLTVVEFYVVAGDGNRTRTYPPPTDDQGTQGANLLYQVDDSASDGPQPLYRIVLSRPEENRFVEVPGGPNSFDQNSDAQMNATFIAIQGSDVEVRYNCGVRVRGAGSRARLPRNWRVNIPGDRDWDGRTSLNLNTQFVYLQLIGSKIHQAAGLPYSDIIPVRVLMNGVDHSGDANPERRFGLYVHVEPYDERFAENHFPNDPDGNLYKKNRPDVKWDNHGTNGTAYRGDGWVKQTNGSLDDWSDMDLFTRTMNSASGPGYLEQVSPVVDVDQWVRWFAVMTLLNDRETNVSNGTDDDYAMYRGALDPRFVLIGHDLDTILGDGDTATSPDSTIFPMLDPGFADQRMPQLDPFFQHPVIARKYYAQLRQLLDTVFAKPAFDELLLNCLSGWIPQARIDQLIAHMDQRRAHVRSVIPSAFTVVSDLPTSAGVPVVTDPSRLELRGTIDAASTTRVLVNGVDVRVDPFSGTWTGTTSADVLVPFGSEWRFLDDGSDQGILWTLPGFDDSGWSPGNGELGYGDGDEATVIGFGPDADNKFATTYFRATFPVADPAEFSALEFTLDYDDGFVVYLNGAAVNVTNLPAAIDHTTYTGEHQETTVSFTVDPAFLLPGENTLAVEMHQAVPDSADLSMDLQLVGLRSTDFGIRPGLNGVVVQALDANGREIARDSIRLWSNSQAGRLIGGTLGSNTTLAAAQGPYVVDTDLVVPAGVTLTIEPGTSVFFADGTRLIVRGRLLAEGTATRRIQLSQRPGDTGGWDGIAFQQTGTDNRMAFVDMDGASAAAQSIEVDASRVTLDQVAWTGTSRTILEVRNPRLLVTRCRFPATDGSEAIHGTGLQGQEFFILDGNTFESATGYNDIVDFSGGRRPGPILQVLNNVFRGASDDVLDLDGTDAHIEGNWFLNVHTDDPGRASTANAIATDGSADLVIARNVFWDVDHALLLKNNSKARFENNTVVGASIAAISFDEPDRPNVVPGDGITIESSIFENAAALFAHQFAQVGEDDPLIVIHRSIVPAAFHGLGSGNVEGGARLADPPGDFSLLPGSTAIGTGLNGLDRGALVAPGASLTGQPPALTAARNATLTIAGPGIVTYQWRLDQGPWSADIATSQPLALSGLAGGTRTVEVVGRDSAGRRQPDSQARRAVWTIDPALRRIVIDEVLADNQGAYPVDGRLPDFVELRNAGASPVDLAGMSLTDDPDIPTRFVFPSGTVLPAGGRIVLLAEDATGAGLHLGFGLDRHGETLLLLDSPARGGAVVDQVEFGPQIPDLAIARRPSDEAWTLARPSPGQPNTDIAVATGDPGRARINEWLAGNNFVFDDDFVEIHNPDPLPIDLGGASLTDDAANAPSRHRLPPLTFVPGAGFIRLVADGDADRGRDHLAFRLSKFMGEIALLSAEGSRIDRVPYLAQQEDISEGRLPDGGSRIARFVLPTPGYSNTSDLAREAALIESIRITEIMYHPPNGAEFEFLEIQNIGSTTLHLAGLRLVGGVEFDFPAEDLAAGEIAVVVGDPAAFRTLYGEVPRVLGAFSGRLDNAGEDIRLEIAALQAAVLDFEYDDEWFPSTDGGGFSLVVRSRFQARALWDREEGWLPGTSPLGTPGLDESAAANTYANWASAVFPSLDEEIAGPSRDPDRDGFPNLVEYALGLDPTTPDPDGTLTPGLEGGFLTLYYNRRRDLPFSVRIDVEVSNDQASWTPGEGSVSQSVVADDGAMLTYRVVDLLPAGSVPARFMRLRVTVPE